MMMVVVKLQIKVYLQPIEEAVGTKPHFSSKQNRPQRTMAHLYSHSFQILNPTSESSTQSSSRSNNKTHRKMRDLAKKLVESLLLVACFCYWGWQWALAWSLLCRSVCGRWSHIYPWACRGDQATKTSLLAHSSVFSSLSRKHLSSHYTFKTS